MDHNISTLSGCEIVDIPRQAIDEMISRPRLARALWWAALVDEGILREWLVNIGARDAKARVAHLFCELLIRLRAVGLAKGDEYQLPITQHDLADTVGLSNVHLNRVLQSLRADGLIEFGGKLLTVRKLHDLMELSGFNPNYLHLADRRKL